MIFFTTKRMVHDVERGGSLYLFIDGLLKTVQKSAEAIGDGLHDIADAIRATRTGATPAELGEIRDELKAIRTVIEGDAQKQIDDAATAIDKSSDKVESAITDSQK